MGDRAPRAGAPPAGVDGTAPDEVTGADEPAGTDEVTGARTAPDEAPGAGRPARLRLFVALELPPAARAALAAFRGAEVDDAVWRPVRDEALHLTLAFLGHRPAGDVAVVASVLERCGGPAPRLALGSALLLPPRRARVLCAEVADIDAELAALQARVSAGLVEAGVYEAERRPFRAHATVARLRAGARAPRTARTGGPEPVEFAGGPLTLFRSHLQRGGAVYEPLTRVPLG